MCLIRAVVNASVLLSLDVSGESSQSGGQFQGRPSEVWSQWQSQHHSQQGGDPHPHPQSSQTEVFQDMLPMPGDPTQGTTNYNIEDFADLGMFPPFSE
ncbi:aryl hydrocarbon receptor nuclear translocator 2-like [Garra rufa]|uniref:aryl hydrocarbon receptor nuclear translocator 2-like n=1 Tax=Garra rufa TaxID=137080 RepID=UPI003CCECEB5